MILATLALLFQTGTGPPNQHAPPPPGPLMVEYDVTVPNSIGLTSADIPRFDPRLGVLTECDIVGVVDFTTTLIAQSCSKGDDPFCWGLAEDCPGTQAQWSKIVIALPASGKKLVNEQQFWPDICVDLDQLETETVIMYAEVGFDPAVRLRSQPHLNELIGTGYTNCPVSRSLQSSYCTSGGCFTESHNFASAAYLTVRYIYSP